MTATEQLLIFTRYPEAGTSKTRLIPALGAEGAASLQQRLAERLFRLAPALLAREGIATMVLISGGEDKAVNIWLDELPWQRQVDGDLGRRMATAFARAFQAGMARVVLVGADIPDIDLAILAKAFAALRRGGAVIGPSQDGGYYLLGLSATLAPALLPTLFTGIAWSTAQVYDQTLARLAAAGCPVVDLPRLADIDLPADLPLARARGLL
jgi:rSAM/selenodomain-associated transferase 1